jgi:hypothetical protein
MSAIAASFQDSPASGLAQDKGAMAFYAVSKNDFCPVLSRVGLCAFIQKILHNSLPHCRDAYRLPTPHEMSNP